MDDAIIKALSVLMVYLTSGEGSLYADQAGRTPLEPFRPEALKALEEAGLVTQGRGVNQISLTEAGIQRARALAAGYLGQTANPL